MAQLDIPFAGDDYQLVKHVFFDECYDDFSWI